MKVVLILVLAVALASAKKADLDERSEFNAMWDSVLSDIEGDG